MERSELIRRAQAGDSTAQGALYESMYKRVYYLCLRLLRSPEDAQDAAQDAFIAAFAALPGLENPNAFEGWLFQIAANKSRNLLRKNGRLAELPEDEDGHTLLDELPDEKEGLIPESAVDNEEKRRLILSIIDALPEVQRACVLLFYYSELSVKQIAEVMDCSEGTVKSRLNYARQKIREGVLEMEERDGIRLHVFVPVGLLLAKDFEWVTAGISTVPFAGAQAASGAETVKTGLLSTLKGKLVAGVAAAAIVVGGGAAVYSQLPREPVAADAGVEQSVGGAPADSADTVQDTGETSPDAADAAQDDETPVFADPAMEQNIRLLLHMPDGAALSKEDLEDIHQIGFIDGGMNIYIHGDWQGDGTISAAPGTVPVSSFEDLALFGTGNDLAVSIKHPAYPVDVAAIEEIVPYAHFVFHDPLEGQAYMNETGGQ